MYKGVDADYYGYRDDEDGLLLTVEAEAEKKGDFVACVTREGVFLVQLLWFTHGQKTLRAVHDSYVT